MKCMYSDFKICFFWFTLSIMLLASDFGELSVWIGKNEQESKSENNNKQTKKEAIFNTGTFVSTIQIKHMQLKWATKMSSNQENLHQVYSYYQSKHQLLLLFLSTNEIIMILCLYVLNILLLILCITRWKHISRLSGQAQYMVYSGCPVNVSWM